MDWMDWLLIEIPVLQGIEKELEGTARVIRLDIASEVGKEAAGRYGVSSVPPLSRFPPALRSPPAARSARPAPPGRGTP